MAEILVVEDDRDTNEAISEYLCSLGYNVRSAYDGKEALQIFFNVAVDLVVLDIMLPEINGISVLAKIREKSDIPILMLTAVCDEYMQIMSFDGDADDFYDYFGETSCCTFKKKGQTRRKQHCFFWGNYN